MKAVFVTGRDPEWTKPLDTPWPLLPFANRPLIEYGFELCLDLGIREVTVVLGDGASRIEAALEDGAQWGVQIAYSSLRPDRPPLSFLRRSPDKWREGLLFVGAPLFPRRLTDAKPSLAKGHAFVHGPPDAPDAFLADASPFLEDILSGQSPRNAARPFVEMGLDMTAIDTARRFFDLNLAILQAERSRYVTAGYYATDGSALGYNVVLSPSAATTPPLAIGNDCRAGPLASVGPAAILGNRVIVEGQTEVSRCVVFDGTYIGSGLELREKIVAGNVVVDPADGTALHIEDPWLLARMGSRWTFADAARSVAGWALACALAIVQLPFFLLLTAAVTAAGAGRFQLRRMYGPRRRILRVAVWMPSETGGHSRLARVFRGLCLDLFPQILAAACGRLWLCGQELLRAPEDVEIRSSFKAYLPAAFHYATARADGRDAMLRKADGNYYAHHRSAWGDLCLLARALLGRFMTIFSDPPAE